MHEPLLTFLVFSVSFNFRFVRNSEKIAIHLIVNWLWVASVKIVIGYCGVLVLSFI